MQMKWAMVLITIGLKYWRVCEHSKCLGAVRPLVSTLLDQVDKAVVEGGYILHSC